MSGLTSASTLLRGGRAVVYPRRSFGGLTVLIWKQLALFGLYEIIHGFILSALAIYIVSKTDAPPSD